MADHKILKWERGLAFKTILETLQAHKISSASTVADDILADLELVMA